MSYNGAQSTIPTGVKANKDCIKEGKLPREVLSPLYPNPLVGKGPKPTQTK